MVQLTGDGDGGVNNVQVDNKKRMATLSTSETQDAVINRESGKVWSLSFEDISPTGANDYVIYVRNDGDKVLHISDIRVTADTAATQLKVLAVSGVPVGGTAIAPISRTIGSAATATATTQTGADITGLNDDGVLFFMQCDTVGEEQHLSTTSRIRIPKGRAVALQVETATASLTGVISLVEEE